jgi:hypothetical protein
MAENTQNFESELILIQWGFQSPWQGDSWGVGKQTGVLNGTFDSSESKREVRRMRYQTSLYHIPGVQRLSGVIS